MESRAPRRPERGAPMSDTPCVNDAAQEAETIKRLREQLAKVEAAVETMPILLSAIERDLNRTPSARGGEVHFHPGTPKRGKCGCPGDNITRWLDELRAALTPQNRPRSAAHAPEAPGQPGRGEEGSGGRTAAL